MNINTKNIVSITEANQNFSKVARLVDENGAAVILKITCPVTSSWNSARQNKSRVPTKKACGLFPSG